MSDELIQRLTRRTLFKEIGYELGYNIEEKGVHVHDLQATILHQLGIDHTRLTYHYQGRDFRLTDVSGEVVHGLLR